MAGCIAKGAKYVLVADGKVYQLDKQDDFKKYAGKSVTVTGSVNGESIAVEKVEAAKSM